MNPVWFPAPAKLNLFLHVTGRREDGYHELQTVFTFIDAADQVGFALRTDGVVFRSEGPEGISPEDDLSVRAARLLKSVTRYPSGVEIRLRKRLPVGGGLGGGSSDAATTLLALNRLWDLNLTGEELQKLALQLGADVPVFIFGRSAFAEGIGEKLQEIELAPSWYLVLVPPVAVSSKEVFADPALTRITNPIKIQDFAFGIGQNDLQTVVCRRYPVVARHLAWLEGHAAARMTGSGACVFARFAEVGEAERIKSLMPAGMHGFVARGLARHPLLETSG
jgi:4-diphosphocytidyl-2-C-methyl-D-erythritol kinase